MIPKIMVQDLAVALLGAAVAACSSDSGPKEVGGTLVGAGAGALIGNADRRRGRQPRGRAPSRARRSAA